MSFNIFILFFILILLFFLSFLFVGNLVGYFLTGVPFVSFPKKFLVEILEIMAPKENETLIDLGCGDATLLIEAEKRYKVKGIGYELSPTAFFLSYFNKIFKKSKIKIFYKNFFKANLKEADLIFCYLFPEIMEKLSEKFKKELKKGTKIFSLSFPLPNWPNKEIRYLDEKNKKWKIYIYQKE
jgi:hypothetical protein